MKLPAITSGSSFLYNFNHYLPLYNADKLKTFNFTLSKTYL